MRHGKKDLRLGSDASHRRAILRSLAIELIEHEKIETTQTKAKQLRPYVEKLITLGKKGDLHSRRVAISKINDQKAVHKLFSDLGTRFADREGGYTRIYKLGPRLGDAAEMALIELV